MINEVMFPHGITISFRHKMCQNSDCFYTHVDPFILLQPVDFVQSQLLASCRSVSKGTEALLPWTDFSVSTTPPPPSVVLTMFWKSGRDSVE